MNPAENLRAWFEAHLSEGGDFGDFSFEARMNVAWLQYLSNRDYYDKHPDGSLEAAIYDAARIFDAMDAQEVYEREHGPAPLTDEEKACRAMNEALESSRFLRART